MTKTVCFDCRGYSTGSCNEKDHLVVTTGNAFRPPRRSQTKRWTQLLGLYESQKQPPGLKILFGFGGNWYWDRTTSFASERSPRALRERNFLNHLKGEYR